MALYGTGLRRAELACLKITDIDSARSVIHVQGGKGRKDRDVMLSLNLLDVLREHWRSLRRKPAVWLFPCNRWHTADHLISPKVIWQACKEAAQRAGIRKEVHPHTLDTVLPLTCSKTVRTCGQSRFCFAYDCHIWPPQKNRRRISALGFPEFICIGLTAVAFRNQPVGFMALRFMSPLTRAGG